jgi:WD40-like Beta Propeller Repeat
VIAAAALGGLLAGSLLAVRLTSPAGVELRSYKFTPIDRDGREDRHSACSPDGKNIAYEQSLHGIMQIFIKDLGAAEGVQLTHADASCGQPFWSPDGATIYYHSKGGLWAVAASGGAPELVLDNAQTVALHPDGKTAVFSRDGKVWTGPLRGGQTREVWRLRGGKADWCGFSPGGSDLAIVDNADLWILPYPTGKARNLGEAANVAAWFPDSGTCS